MCREVFIRKQLGFIFDNDAALMMPRVCGNSGECNSEKRRVHCDQDGRVGICKRRCVLRVRSWKRD
jgi:hypothetical protein